jgi:hypothetical protein
MIITKEHYPIIWKEFKEYYKSEDKAAQGFIKLFTIFEYPFYQGGKEYRDYVFPDYPNRLSVINLKGIIIKEDFDKFPELDLANNFHNNSSDYKYEKLYTLPQDLFDRISDRFKEKNIDLLLELERPVLIFNVKAYFNHVQEKLDRKLIKYSSYFTKQVINGKCEINTEEKLEIFESLTSKHQTISLKESHEDAMLLLKKAIELNYPQEKIIQWFKYFTANNSTINPDALDAMNWIKNHIKDWDLNKHFTLAEQKTLFQNSSSGITMKEVDAIYYFFDLNLIKKKYPKITTTMTIETNLQNLTDYLPNLLGNTPHYVGVTSKFDKPEVQLTIMFEEGHKKIYSDLINFMIEKVCSSDSVIDMKEFKKIVDATLLSHHLDSTMPQKETEPRKKLKM